MVGSDCNHLVCISSSSGVRLAQAQANKLSYVTEELGQEAHPEKSGYLAIGSKEFKKQVETETNEDPLMFGDFILKRKTSEKYLGDILDENGLAASVESTIRERTGKVRGAVMELTVLTQDFRMEAVGGVLGAIDVWNVCILPSLLNNCGVWTNITEKAIKLCEEQQSMFVRSILRLPGSTPTRPSGRSRPS